MHATGGHGKCHAGYVWNPLSLGQQVPPGAPWVCRMMESQPPLAIPLLQCRGCRWISAPPVTSTGCRGATASPWSAPRDTRNLCSSAPLLLHQPWWLQSCFSHIFPALWLQLLRVFSPLEYVIPEATIIMDGVSLGQPIWHWLCQSQGKLLTGESTPVAPLLPKNSPHKANTFDLHEWLQN